MLSELPADKVVAFLAFLAAFAAGVELSQMTPRRKPEPGWKFPVRVLCVVAIIITAILIIQQLQLAFPEL